MMTAQTSSSLVERVAIAISSECSEMRWADRTLSEQHYWRAKALAALVVLGIPTNDWGKPQPAAYSFEKFHSGEWRQRINMKAPREGYHPSGRVRGVRPLYALAAPSQASGGER